MIINPECIIVGNGSTLLNKKHGEIIDKFPNIVRFNAYTLESYQDFVGSKTTIWFNVINFVNKNTEWRMNVPYDKIFLHSWQWDMTKDNLFIDFTKFYENTNMCINKTTRNSIIEMQTYTNNSQYSSFSTGAIAIWLMLKRYKQLHITGFDWWNTTIHHYNDKAPRGTLHNPQIEKIFIDKLISDKKVIKL